MNFQKLLERKTRLEKELEAVNSKIEEQKYTKKTQNYCFLNSKNYKVKIVYLFSQHLVIQIKVIMIY